MKDFAEYKDELYTCSRCGLCQSVCPIFDVTKKETTVSRGFFSLLSGIIKGHLKFNKKVRKNIDVCLNCNKCSSFCPSGIDAQKIITSAKIASYKFAPLWKKILVSCFYSKFFLQCAGLVKIYRFFPVLNFTKFGMVLYEFLQPNIKYNKQNSTKKSDLKVAIFAGCINTYFNSSSLSALKMILEQNAVTYDIPDFDCCAMPSYGIGDIQNFKKIASKNLSKISDDTDFILFDCATCKKAFELYSEALKDEKSSKVLAKCLHINEFLVEQNIELPQISQKICYHTPCHSDFEEKTIQLIEKTGMDRLPTENRCCGSAGLFFVENNAISNSLALKKAQEIELNDFDLILTDCPLCRLGLIKGSILNQKVRKITNFVEVFAKNFKK